MPNLKVYNCDSAFLHEDTLLQLEQIFPGLKINQRLLKIATPEQSFDTDFGFWDIEAGKVSCMSPVKDLCEASGSNKMLRVTSKDILKLTTLSLRKPWTLQCAKK